MALKDLQKDVDKWVSQYEEGYWPPHVVLARLAEEVGELAREINHLYGPKQKKPGQDTRDLGGEMADIIFTLCCLANSKEINLDEAWERTMKKYYGRDHDRYKRK